MEHTNGTAAPAANGHAQATSQEERLRRAEEMVDRIAERVRHFVSVAGREVLRLGARAREEAEDMWAEARLIRERYEARQNQ